MIQGTQKWHEWRSKGLGGSDANVIWAQAYGKSVERLIYEKAGLIEPKDVSSFATNMGKKYEPEIIAAASEIAGVEFVPRCVTQDYVLWMRSSLDGHYVSLGRKIIAEAKLGGEQLISQTRFGLMPYIHQGQILHNMICAGAESCFYAVRDFGSGDIAVHQFFMDNYERQAVRLILAEHIVWDAIQNIKDTYNLDSPDEEQRYIAGHELSKIAKEIMDGAKADLMKTIGNRTEGTIGRIQFKQVSRKGTVDWKRMVNEGVDIEAYRGDPITSMRFTVKSDEI